MELINVTIVLISSLPCENILIVQKNVLTGFYLTYEINNEY